MIRKRTFATLLAGAALTACASSPPVQFLTLTPVVSPGGAAARLDDTIQIVAVHIPATLDRQEMVRETAPNTLQISDRHRWAAPLGQMVQRVLTQDLARRLPAGSVILPDQPAPPGTALIVIDILQFETDASGSVVFDGSWSLLHKGDDDGAQNHPLHLTAQTDATSYTHQARVMSQIVGEVADTIAARLRGGS